MSGVMTIGAGFLWQQERHATSVRINIVMVGVRIVILVISDQ